MIVVADTTPLRYLVQIGHDGLLPALYGRVIIPPGVADELQHPNTPPAIRAWIAQPPAWIEIRGPSRPVDTTIQLGRGEREAIALAEELSADLLLVDDSDARQEAQRRRLHTAGTLRVLADAADLGLVDLEKAVAELRETSFRVNPRLIDAVLEEHRKKRASEKRSRPLQ